MQTARSLNGRLGSLWRVWVRSTEKLGESLAVLLLTLSPLKLLSYNIGKIMTQGWFEYYRGQGCV